MSSRGDHGAKSPFGVRVFEIGITLGLESELRTARWSMILSRLSTVVELIQKLLQVYTLAVEPNRKVFDQECAKKVELKAYTLISIVMMSRTNTSGIRLLGAMLKDRSIVEMKTGEGTFRVEK
ncbi:hypothetical protein Tco_1377251 [Tanacetum coccineum]